MPSRQYSITEPHPSVPSSSYMYSGRGGAGNIARVKSSDVTPSATASGPASRAQITPASEGYFSAGRGGAGNVRSIKERAIFSFDEELAAQRRMQDSAAPVFHIGRGGAGNFVDEIGRGRTGSRGSDSSSDSGSPARKNSTDSVWNRMSKTFSRNSVNLGNRKSVDCARLGSSPQN